MAMVVLVVMGEHAGDDESDEGWVVSWCHRHLVVEPEGHEPDPVEQQLATNVLVVRGGPWGGRGGV